MDDPHANGTLESLDAAFSALVAGVSQIQGSLGKQAAELKSQADALLSSLAAQADELDRQVAAFREQVEAFRSKNDSGAGLIEELNARIDAAERESAEKSGRLAELNREKTALEAALATERDAQASSQAALKESVREETAAALGAEFEAERGKLLAQVSAQDAELGSLREQFALLQEKLGQSVGSDTVEQLKAEAASERERFELERAELERELRDARDALASGLDASAAQELRAQLAKEKERANTLDQRLRDETARGTKSVLAEQLADALKEVDALRDEIRRLEEAAAAARAGAADSSVSSRSAQVEEAMLQRVASTLRDGHKRTLGELLIEAEIITPEQLDEALDEQRHNPHTHLGAILHQKGYATSEAIAQALALQCNVGYVRLGETFIESDAAKLISGRLAAQHRCIPIRTVDEEGLIVAIANPLDLVAIEDIERSTGRRVEVLVSTEQEIRDAVERHYAAE